MTVPELHEVPNHTIQTSAVLVFNHVSPATMAKAQSKDSVLGLVIQYVPKEENQKSLAISKIRFKAMQMFLLQFDQLVMDILHQ